MNAQRAAGPMSTSSTSRARAGGAFGVPLGRDASVHEEPAVVRRGQALAAQPVEQGVAVRSLEDLGEGVLAFSRCAHRSAHSQQVQVVIAEQAVATA